MKKTKRFRGRVRLIKTVDGEEIKKVFKFERMELCGVEIIMDPVDHCLIITAIGPPTMPLDRKFAIVPCNTLSVKIVTHSKKEDDE